jgi:hypothetical protein
VNRAGDFNTKRVAATDARIHFGELVDEVAEGRKIAEVERSDGYTVVVEPASDVPFEEMDFDVEGWLTDLDSIQERIRAYLVDNPITETSTEIIRKLRDNP